MALHFSIENQQTMPDGGPVSFTITGKRSVDIGRDQHLDWTLPDPTRFISGKHCEVHFKDGGYWLHDVSTNGTFLNGADQRMRGPHLLRNGDRFIVGQYIVVVTGDADSGPGAGTASSENAAAKPSDYQQLWANDRDAPPPISAHHLKIAKESARPINPEFLDWAAAVPEPDRGLVRKASAFDSHSPSSKVRSSNSLGNGHDLGWDSGPLAPLPPTPEPIATPAPRRPIWTEPDAADALADPFAPQVVRPPEPAPADTNAFKSAPTAPVPRIEQPASPAPPPPKPLSDGTDGDTFKTLLARGAKLPDDFFAAKNSAELAEQLGLMLRLTIDNLMVLLQARHQAKRMTRSTTQTTIQAIENNPLKFSPTTEDAMRVLFGPATRSYLDASGALIQGFGDLKSHQLKTYMAMQHAVGKLMADIDPNKIVKSIDDDPSKQSWIQNSKVARWDEFVLRWKTQFGDEAPVDTFMLHFADYYDGND